MKLLWPLREFNKTAKNKKQQQVILGKYDIETAKAADEVLKYILYVRLRKVGTMYVYNQYKF
jgi:hypothetical protein